MPSARATLMGRRTQLRRPRPGAVANTWARVLRLSPSGVAAPCTGPPATAAATPSELAMRKRDQIAGPPAARASSTAEVDCASIETTSDLRACASSGFVSVTPATGHDAVSGQRTVQRSQEPWRRKRMTAHRSWSSRFAGHSRRRGTRRGRRRVLTSPRPSRPARRARGQTRTASTTIQTSSASVATAIAISGRVALAHRPRARA